MTDNQIAYEALQENIRHNKVFETETNRHNLVTEGETKRHNLVGESIGWKQAEASMIGAQASALQAAVAHGRLQLDRELQVYRVGEASVNLQLANQRFQDGAISLHIREVNRDREMDAVNMGFQSKYEESLHNAQVYRSTWSTLQGISNSVNAVVTPAERIFRMLK